MIIMYTSIKQKKHIPIFSESPDLSPYQLNL